MQAPFVDDLARPGTRSARSDRLLPSRRPGSSRDIRAGRSGGSATACRSKLSPPGVTVTAANFANLFSASRAGDAEFAAHGGRPATHPLQFELHANAQVRFAR